MARALFINETYVKENSPVDDNVDMKLINPTIWKCQKKYLEKTLGTVLYDDICAEIISDSDLSTVPLYLTLVDDYIADALLYWVLHELQVPLTYKFRNKSVGKNTDPNQQPADFEEHKYLRDDFKKDAQYFTERLEAFLCANSTYYPLYNTSTEDDDLLPEKTPPQVAVYLGGAVPKRNKYGYYDTE